MSHFKNDHFEKGHFENRSVRKRSFQRMGHFKNDQFGNHRVKELTPSKTIVFNNGPLRTVDSENGPLRKRSFRKKVHFENHRVKEWAPSKTIAFKNVPLRKRSLRKIVQFENHRVKERASSTTSKKSHFGNDHLEKWVTSKTIISKIGYFEIWVTSKTITSKIGLFKRRSLRKMGYFQIDNFGNVSFRNRKLQKVKVQILTLKFTRRFISKILRSSLKICTVLILLKIWKKRILRIYAQQGVTRIKNTQKIILCFWILDFENSRHVCLQQSNFFLKSVGNVPCPAFKKNMGATGGTGNWNSLKSKNLWSPKVTNFLRDSRF